MVIAHRLFTQCFKSKVVSEFIYTILGLLLAVVMVMLLHGPVYVWFHRSWGSDEEYLEEAYRHHNKKIGYHLDTSNLVDSNCIIVGRFA